MAAPVLQLRVPEDTLARIDHARGDDTRSAWLQRLIDRELAGQTATPAAGGPSLAALSADEPGNGALCMGPGCFQRDTSKYGLRQVPLLPRLPCSPRGARLPAGPAPRHSTPHPPRRGLTASIDSLSRLREHPV